VRVARFLKELPATLFSQPAVLLLQVTTLLFNPAGVAHAVDASHISWLHQVCTDLSLPASNPRTLPLNGPHASGCRAVCYTICAVV